MHTMKKIHVDLLVAGLTVKGTLTIDEKEKPTPAPYVSPPLPWEEPEDKREEHRKREQPDEDLSERDPENPNISVKQRYRLQTLGYSETEIDGMDGKEAWSILHAKKQKGEW